MEKDWIPILIYFLLLSSVICALILQRYLLRKTNYEMFVVQKFNEHTALENLVLNIKMQCRVLFDLGLKRKNKWLFYSILSLFLACLLILATFFVILSVFVGLDYLQTGIIIYIIALNLLFITKQYIYYRSLYANYYNTNRIAMLHRTNYNHFKRNLGNGLQIAILILEFIQLTIFPLKHLLKSINNDNAPKVFDYWQFFALLPKLTEKFYIVQYWSIFISVISFFLLGLIIHFYTEFKLKSVLDLNFVNYLVPIATIFTNSAACMFNQNDDMIRCKIQLSYPTLYTFCSLLGFTVSYLMLTIFLTSYEKKPTEGEIEYKSKGVAVTKNISNLNITIGLLIILNYLLVSNSYNRVKGVLFIVLLSSIVSYSIRSRPCYVSQVNYWRTAGFCLALWCCFPIVFLDYENSSLLLVITIISSGWLIIFLIFVTGRYCFSVLSNNV